MKTDRAAGMSKRTKWLIALVTAFVLYTVVGFFVVPAIIKAQLLKRLPELTKRQASIERVKFNPFVLSLTIDNLALKEANGNVFSSFGELYVNFQLSSIFKRAFVFDEISLTDPLAQITYLGSGAFNFSNLLTNQARAPAPATAPKPQELPAVLVYHLRITNGAVAFTDLTRKTPFNIRYQPINASLTDFTTRRDKRSPYGIFASSDNGETFGWKGRVTINPLQSSGTFRLGGLKLDKYNPYSQDYALFEITDGTVDVTADYHYDSASNALDLQVSNAAIFLNKFKLKEPDTGEEVVSIPALTIEGAQASLAARTAEIGLIKSSGGSILVRQGNDGKINLLKNLVLPAANPAPAAAAPASTGPAWSAKIDEIRFDDYSIKAEDKAPPKPAVFNIDKLGFDLKNISNASNAPVALAAGLRLQGTGDIGLNGAVTLMPLSAEVVVGVTNLDLRVGQPYVEEQVKMAIARGGLNINGHARFSPGKINTPLVSFVGDVSINNFEVTDEVLYDPLVEWDSFDITGIDVALQPDKFHVDRIKVVKPKHTAIVEPDGRLNILTILPEKKAGPKQTNAAPPAKLPEITLGELVFENAAVHFVDKSLEPNCTFDVEESSGSVKNISSLIDTPSEFSVKGRVEESSTYSVGGRINPMPDNLFLDATFVLTNTGLTSFSPYTEKYVGRPLNKGKLSVALRYKINKKALDATNDIFVDQLTLGAKNGSTNATKLPVKLAIALLKDRHGRIKLDVPVNGQIDNPKFKVWPIIRGVIVNLAVKAATSPFSLLGSMFGGGPELSFVAFDPGKSDIPAGETNKLGTLTKALFNRPELTLEINGSVDPAKDRDIMVRAKFDRQIKALYLKELTDAGKPTLAENEISLSTNDYSRLLAMAYSNTFGAYHPPGANQSTNAVASEPVKKIAPPAPPPGPSFFGHAAARVARIELEQPAPTTPVTPTPPPALSATNAPIAPSELEDMEQQLIQKIEITSDDYRQLMKDRARHVEEYLLKSGQVTADRLFITAPRPMDANSKGEDRVNMSLD